ncbi:EamA family transporter [Patescibacteria group bacterium]
MQTWFIFALLSVFVIAGSEISQKVSLTQKVNISAITNNFFVWTLQGLGGLILAILFNRFEFSFGSTELVSLIFVAFVYFLGGTFFYTSYKGNSPSISLVLGSISIIISTILGILFFNESTSSIKFLGIFIILLSIFIANYKKELRFEKYNTFALLGGICFGVAFTLDKSLVLKSSPFIYVSILCFSVALVSIVLKPRMIISDTRRMKLNNFLPMLSSALFGTLFNSFTFMAYANSGSVGAVDAMNNSSIFLVIIFEIFFLKDKSNLGRKIFGAILVTLGVILLSTV